MARPADAIFPPGAGRLVVLVVIAALLATAWMRGSRAAEREHRLEQAQRFLADGHLDAAVHGFQRLEADLGEDPEFGAGLALARELRRAQQLLQSGQVGPAAALLESLTEAHPDQPLGFLLLGRVRAQQGRPEESQQALQRARELAPSAGRSP